jgi:hypothetical protein
MMIKKNRTQEMKAGLVQKNVTLIDYISAHGWPIRYHSDPDIYIYIATSSAVSFRRTLHEPITHVILED